MALVLGFYERLVSAIHSISPKTIKSLLNVLRGKENSFENFKTELERIDAFFLFKLTVGALVAIVALAKVMTFLLVEWHDPTYGFFFGLVLLSVVSPFQLIKRKSFSVIVFSLIGAVSVWGISNAVSGDDLIEKAQIKHELKLQKEAQQGHDPPSANKETAHRSVTTYLVFFMMGVIAISGMILPGISGSFLLLLMGGYFEMLKAIVDRDFSLLSVFALGCLVGVLLFTRLLNYLLRQFHDHTLGALLGLVMGSLWAIWPFKETAQVGEEIIYLSNRIPDSLGATEWMTAIAVIMGMVVIAFFLKVEKV